MSVFFNFFLLFSFLSLSLGSQPRLLRRRLASPACPVPPSSELAPCLLPPSSTHAHEAAREAAALAHEAPALGGRRGGVLAIAHEGAHEATCSPRWVPPSSSSRAPVLPPILSHAPFVSECTFSLLLLPRQRSSHLGCPRPLDFVGKRRPGSKPNILSRDRPASGCPLIQTPLIPGGPSHPIPFDPRNQTLP